MLDRLLLVGLATALVYAITRIRYARLEQFKKLPQLKPSPIWGHLSAFNDFLKQCRPDCHSDEVFAQIRSALGNPPMLLMDLRPVTAPILIISDHEAAERVSKSTKVFPWSVPKSPTMKGLKYLIGPLSLLTKDNEEWKQIRKAFNPGFAPSHLMGMLPAILDKTWIFLRHLDSFVASGEPVALDKPLINLTFDIIGAVTMDVDFDAQHMNKADRGELIRLYDDMIRSYSNIRAASPWWFHPWREYTRMSLASRIDSLLKPIIREEYARQQSGSAKQSKSVLALSLHGTDKLTELRVSQACDQIKTFLFAGHDTTSILLSWIFYELSRCPRALKAVRDELDDIFGPDPSPDSVRARLLAPGGEDLVSRMSYISAVIKEALRLHPPAGSARMAPPGSGFTLPNGEGEEVCVDGFVLYLCASHVQRDPKVYGETANDFVPERWLGDTDTSEKTNDVVDDKSERKIPASAWRPFERGPRNCIGQELANIEARVILAVLARRYDFVKVGLGEFELDEKGQPILDEKGQYRVKSELYSGQQVTAKPVDGMVMKVKLSPRVSSGQA
ncbi:putative sterigmatocystin biosynthesis P450 monooxygenase stcS [Echria macrotheca]|uniref:Sterigmatocystin biosynthesis P450 monooxygenase stcS n=1 Tax=Echria macrotheca TaxID=438768 RepID=A0AAJ0F1M6_9PEZI|nr:putative sterigmatocystin biosynthesis P450 monooxygenase stcS [Echria macrotheca]